MDNFLEEYSLLRETGTNHKREKLAVNIKAFVRDTPTRCFLKGIKGHTAFHALLNIPRPVKSYVSARV